MMAKSKLTTHQRHVLQKMADGHVLWQNSSGGFGADEWWFKTPAYEPLKANVVASLERRRPRYIVWNGVHGDTIWLDRQYDLTDAGRKALAETEQT